MRIISTMSAKQRKVRSREDDNYSNWAIISYNDFIILLACCNNKTIAHLKDCYFLLLKFFKNFDYRYCLLTTWIKHCLNEVNAFEPVPFSVDRQQQFYLYQLP